MLFNSYLFIFGFLPLVLAGYYTLGSFGANLPQMWLMWASLAFYTWWHPPNLPILLASILFNYVVGQRLLADVDVPRRKMWLAFGVATNLIALGIYKYLDFGAGIMSQLLDTPIASFGIALPLGISFFTFTQIAFLVDAARREVRDLSPGNYCLFVTFFPHLIAGPILHHREMMPQFAGLEGGRDIGRQLAVGLSIFGIGLFKKTVLADGAALYSDPVFAQATSGGLTLLEAWGGALAYTFQLYFDFSGYSDMAVGLAWMFGIRMPANFFSPYKATSIIEFWRRWHITLSRFLRDYLYVPLGGNRFGVSRRYFNLLVTMLLGGLWHGAGWTFVCWGLLHGLYLCANHGWRALSRDWRVPQWLTHCSAASGWALTFVAVVIAWVFFRAESLHAAFEMLRGMAGLNGTVVPANWELKLGVLAAWLRTLGVEFGNPGLFFGSMQLLALASIGAIAFLAPNSHQLFGSANPALIEPGFPPGGRPIWRPAVPWAFGLGCATAVAVLTLTRTSQFLYFQF